MRATLGAPLLCCYAMPKVKSYSAAWLSKNTPGHQLFEPSSDSLRARALSPANASKKDAAPGPRRTIATRGTQAFVAAGREIRWGDLAYFKEQWSNERNRNGNYGGARIKREDSTQPLNESVEGDGPPGIRVSLCSTALIDDNGGWLTNSSYFRRSKHDVPKIFDNS